MPTLTDKMSTIPLGTSVPSALIGLVYGTAFFTMGMTFSAAGSFATGILWSLIAARRSPRTGPDVNTQPSATPDRSNSHAPAGD